MIFPNNPKSGFSLIEAMIGIAAVGLFAVGSMTMMQQKSQASKKLEIRQAKFVLKRMIMGRTSCPESFPNIENCSPGSLLELVDQDGEVVVPNSGEGLRVSGYTVRAECNTEGNGVTVKAVRLRKNTRITSNRSSDFLKDPLTGRRNNWSSRASLLYGKKVDVCPNLGKDYGISGICTRKRSNAYINDFVVWCPSSHPKLYSCAQVDDQAPGVGQDVVASTSYCTDNRSCSFRRIRAKLGGNGTYYERVEKSVGGNTVDGCWLYDKKHTHTPHKADVMCCQ